MSTISKIDPRVRQARADRRSLCVSLATSPQLTHEGALLHKRIELIRRNPRHSGVWKQELFEDVITRFEATIPADRQQQLNAALAAAHA